MAVFNKIKAGALQYVLIISVIIAIVLLGFIMLINLQQKVKLKNKLYKESISNVMNGFSYQSHYEIPHNKETIRQFSQNFNEETVLKRKPWGVFDVAFVSSKVKKEFFMKVALMGWVTDKPKALYLKENNTPLVVVGKTKIKGDVYIPMQGVKTGNIAGNSFAGSALFYGKEYRSKSQLPSIKNKVQLRNYFKHNFWKEEAMALSLNEGINLVNSFNQNTLVYSDSNLLKLENLSLTGNIMIRSNTKIIIEKSAKLKDIILMAPEIIVKSGVTGNFQCFAGKMIQVENECNLNYPSALIVLNIEENKDSNITIARNSSVKGCVVYDSDNDTMENLYTPQIVISENSIVTGNIYCSANTELLGTVRGTVFTNNFITKQYGSTYINHLYNGQILNDVLSKEFVGLPIDATKSSIAKWLY